jgi:hypothetical protein
MATGLYVLPEGSVMVAYGPRHIPISCAQYKANGYKPVLEKLVAKSPAANRPPLRPKVTRPDTSHSRHDQPAPRSRTALSRVTIAPCTPFSSPGVV